MIGKSARPTRDQSQNGRDDCTTKVHRSPRRRLAPSKFIDAVSSYAASGALLIVLLKVVEDPQEIPAWLWNYELFSLSFAGGQWSIPPVQAGWVLTGLVVYFILRSFEAKVIKLANWQNTLFRFAAGVIFSTIGSLFAWTHIKIFDKFYLWWGKTHRLIEDPQDGNKNC